MPTSTQKLAIAITVLAIAGFLGYKVFAVPAAPTDLESETETIVVGQDILALVEKLRVISIDPSLFSSAVFNNLKDLTLPLSPEPQGRTNPFAPIGIETGF